jgi:transcriptional regulator with XRE-family HTH domain
MSTRQASLHQAIGTRLRALRTERNLRQEQVAGYARVWGLDWTQSTVAAIEAGDRPLSLEEFFALPLVYAPLQLPDLFPGEGWVDLRVGSRTGWTTPESHLRDELLGKAFAAAPSPTAPPEVPDDVDYAIVEPFKQLEETPGRLIKHIKIGDWGDPAAEMAFLDLPGHIQQRRREIEVAAKGDAERKAARKFVVSALLVSAVAFRLYGRSLSEERDQQTTMYTRSKSNRGEYARTHGIPEDHPSMRSEQAIRGHVTRTLLAAMKDTIEYYQAKQLAAAQHQKLTRPGET